MSSSNWLGTLLFQFKWAEQWRSTSHDKNEYDQSPFVGQSTNGFIRQLLSLRSLLQLIEKYGTEFAPAFFSISHLHASIWNTYRDSLRLVDVTSTLWLTAIGGANTVHSTLVWIGEFEGDTQKKVQASFHSFYFKFIHSNRVHRVEFHDSPRYSTLWRILF